MAITLGAHGYEVHVIADEAEALRDMHRFIPSVIVLDLGVPGLGDADMVRRLRLRSEVPMIVLSDRSTAQERATVIDAGADDYLAKPFQMREMLSSVRAAERRATRIPVRGQPLIVTDHFTVDLAGAQVSRNGQPIRLTSTHWQLLALLVRHAGEVVTAEQLLADVWGPAFAGDTSALRVGVAQLRGKLEPDPSHPRHLITEKGLGYRFRG